ncbi:hypothetical protein IRJ41_006384 [Triplophysa rosa]|uniref:Uncharacterized protein n=1 Tax=Triplophysa rosa TaxID=992332 RepID=A0A9W7WHT1_TRIRA|nr:hypothetical protein IRJ41_006384 [Triplophysa rosa]
MGESCSVPAHLPMVNKPMQKLFGTAMRFFVAFQSESWTDSIWFLWRPPDREIEDIPNILLQDIGCRVNLDEEWSQLDYRCATVCEAHKEVSVTILPTPGSAPKLLSHLHH